MNEQSTQRYYLSTFMKVLSIIGTAMIVLSTGMLYFVDRYTSIEFPGGIIAFVIMDVLFIAVVAWRMTAPVVELSDTGITVGIPFLFKKNSARWADIEGMVINEISNLGMKERQVKILVKSGGTSTRELVFSHRAVERPEEIIAALRTRIPERGHEDIRKAAVFQKPIGASELTYSGWTATERGLSSKRDFIPWDMIRELKYPALVIGGYGATTVTFTDSKGANRNITIKASASEKYLTFLRFLIQRSSKATIDPGLIKALEYSPKDAKADLLSGALLVFGIALMFILSAVVYYYSTGIAAGYLNSLLLLPFGMVPLGLTIKGLTGRFRGESPAKSHRMLWPSLSVFAPVLATMYIFIFSPFSLYWLAGDISRNAGDLALAERYYEASLKRVPGNIDVLYEVGKLHLKQGKHEKALPYLQEAYTKDPTWWGPQAVVLIPDTLMKLKRYDEAMKWCKQILKDRPNKIDIAKAISKKQDEIISEKSYYERQNVDRETVLAALSEPTPPETPTVTPQAPMPFGIEEKGASAAITETQKTASNAGAPASLTGPQSYSSKRCGLASSSGIVRFLSGEYTGNRTIDLSLQILSFIYISACLFFIARRLQITKPWTAWIPIVNLWTVVSAAGKPWWWILLLIIPFANLFIWANLWMCISENVGKNKRLGLLMLVPLVNFVFLGMLSFSGTERMRAPAPA